MVREKIKEKKIGQKEYRYTRREIREYTGWSNTQIKIQIDILADFEYMYVHKGRNGLAYVYELVYQGEGELSAKFMMGLVDIETLKKKAGGK